MKNPLDPYTYILVDRKPVQHNNNEDWFRWFGNERNRRVALTDIGAVSISTVFIGIDRSYGREPQPLVFETHIFGGKFDGDELLAATWEQAEQCHTEAVALVRAKDGNEIT